ncbi:MAG: nitrate reductase molybdenum cofactor assembly chaperone [Gammaproteobacteria bacterium]
MMKTYKALAILLLYPESGWVSELDGIETALAAEHAANGGAATVLGELFAMLRKHPLLELQQNYVVTFDQTPSHSLHLFEHVHGESRDRGQAMVDLLTEYRRHGLTVDADELPDYVPLFLEYLSELPPPDALELLDEAIDVLALIGRKLRRNASPYQSVFSVLEAMATRAPAALPEAPVRDMDDTLARFGPRDDGREPLLTPRQRHEVAVARVPRPGETSLSRALR